MPGQFFHDFSGLPVAPEKGIADKNQHIVTEGAARGHPLAQLLGPIDGWILARGAGEESFVRDKGTHRKRLYRFGLRLGYLQRGLTIGAMSLGRAKMQARPLGEERWGGVLFG